MRTLYGRIARVPGALPAKDAISYKNPMARSAKKIGKLMNPILWWGILIIVLLGIFRGLESLSLPTPITVYRNGKTDEYSWQTFILSIVINLAALYIAITTKLGDRKPNDLGYVLRRNAKIIGWIIGIGGWLGTVHLLAILLGWKQPP
jgi:hypothetical protein